MRQSQVYEQAMGKIITNRHEIPTHKSSVALTGNTSHEPSLWVLQLRSSQGQNFTVRLVLTSEKSYDKGLDAMSFLGKMIDSKNGSGNGGTC